MRILSWISCKNISHQDNLWFASTASFEMRPLWRLSFIFTFKWQRQKKTDTNTWMYLISPPQNSDFNLWFFSDLLKLKITVWWINFNLSWLLYISIYEFHEFTSILFIILGVFCGDDDIIISNIIKCECCALCKGTTNTNHVTFTLILEYCPKYFNNQKYAQDEIF